MLELFPESSGAQVSLDFPESLTERYRPRAIEDFIGLEKPKKIARNLVKNPFASAWMFVGPSGTGKTTLALAIAAAIPAELHHIPSQECNLESIERMRRTCQYVPAKGFRCHLVLMDEAHKMTSAAQTSLLSKLDATNFPPNTIIIGTANSTDGLDVAFLSRFHQVDFSSYGISADATALLERIWNTEAPGKKGPNFARLVKEANNNVRESLMSLETELMCA